MARLIERAENGQVMIAGCGGNCKHEYKYCNNAMEDCPTINEIYEKLALYEDAEEQGLLLRLQVVVGSTVYIISRGKIIPLKIVGIYVNENSIAMYGMNEQHFGYGNVTLYDNKKPIEWFLTKEEAEQALKQMGE